MPTDRVISQTGALRALGGRRVWSLMISLFGDLAREQDQAIDGPILSIRRFAVSPLQVSDLTRLKTLTPQIADFLAGCVKARLNLLISGGTGAGKTTLLNVLSGFIPEEERIETARGVADWVLESLKTSAQGR